MWPKQRLPAAKSSREHLLGLMLSCYLPFLLLFSGLSEGWGGKTASQEPLTFQCQLISSFLNDSWVQNLGSGWLGDLETHRWDLQTSTIQFLWPWARGHFSAEQWKKLQSITAVFLISFTRDVQDFIKVFRKDYPVVIQVRVSYSEGSPVSFFQAAFQGTDFMHFQGDSWKPAPGAESTSWNISRILNQDQGTRDMLQNLLNHTIPQFVGGLLETGQKDIERQVRPEVWLSSSTTSTPGQLKLLCHVSGFYPKLVRVTWIKNGQEQPGTQTSDLLPNSDGTWWIQVILIVEAGNTANLACRVEHSSLGGQDIIQYWAKSSTWSFAVVIIAGIVLGLLLIGIIGYCLYRIVYKRHRLYEDMM
ncbi:antigen-presenting glycoprotein CD1d [Sarcophilus harrisii]|uniref:Ig-like domain-containing protein n=2 Tax=Sarcophilus harrisii TaxID=9305 RepID=G3W056_SARHA|nr:antigen-presenting glycoprotein CD1d [Sarcophilus harrisii]